MDLTLDESSLVGDIIGTVLLLAFLMAVAWVSGRILGVRQGLWRALLSALVGVVTANALIVVQFGSDAEVLNDWGDLAKVGAGFAGYLLVGTMLASIVLDIMFRPRTRRGDLPSIPHPIRAIRRRAALIGRLVQIASIARRNGLMRRTGLTEAAGARALRRTLEECGGMFVKFGQIASTREDLLPPVVLEELAQLRTAAPPLPPGALAAVLAEELDPEARARIVQIDPEPLAAASIGVTHRARLADGRHVIVKVQRPGVDEIVRRDGRVLLWGARQLERRWASARALGILDVASELLAGVTEELDFTREAANNSALRSNRSEDVGVRFPEVFADITTTRVLVMEEVDGRPVSDRAAVAATGVAADVLADRLLSSFLGQVLTDGIYHADPHPGNILIDGDGVLYFIDFGAVGTLDPITLQALQLMALGWSLRDPAMLARSVRRLAGPSAADLDMAALEFDLGGVMAGVESSGFGAESLQGVMEVLRKHDIRTPRALTLLGRATITMEGTLRLLDPGADMASRAQQLVGEQMRVPDSLAESAQSEILRALPSLRSLPALAEEVGLQTTTGRLGIRVERYGRDDRRVVSLWLDRIIFAGVGMVGLLGSALLLLASAMTGNESVATYLRVVGFVGLAVASVMQLRTIAQVMKRRYQKEEDFLDH